MAPALRPCLQSATQAGSQQDLCAWAVGQLRLTTASLPCSDLPALHQHHQHHPNPCPPPPLPQAYEELKTTDKAKDMREQQLLRSQLDLAYKTGDRAKAEKLAALLAPTNLADIGKVVRPPASGT